MVLHDRDCSRDRHGPDDRNDGYGSKGTVLFERDGSNRVSSLRAFHRPFEEERCVTAIVRGIGTGRMTSTTRFFVSPARSRCES